MKHSTILNISLFTLIGMSGANAATNAHIFSNSIVAHSIASTQHAIIQNAFDLFSGSAHSAAFTPLQHTDRSPARPTEDPATTYGRAQMYGSAPMYGEFNDDGRAGRSGGDTFNANAALSNIWINWQHLGDNITFDNFAHLDSNINIYTLGLAGGQSKTTGTTSKWGIYTGFIDSEQHNPEIAIDSQGGYFGIYNGNTFGNLGLYATLNGGVLNNSTDTIHGTDEHSSFWAGGAIHAKYDIALDRTLTLQPGLTMGYTWIRGEDYTSASGDILKNDTFGMFEVTPALRMIKHVSNNWFGALNLRYVMIFDNGGDTTVNGNPFTSPESGNFVEYTISLEKSVANFNISANLGRRDSNHFGWIGNINIKYIF